MVKHSLYIQESEYTMCHSGTEKRLISCTYPPDKVVTLLPVAHCPSMATHPTWNPAHLFPQPLLESLLLSTTSRTVRSQRQESPRSYRPLLPAPFCHIQLTICQSPGSPSRPTVQLPTPDHFPTPIDACPLSLGFRVRV